MNLAIDVGNTNTKLGLFKENELVKFYKFQNTEPFDIQALFDEFMILKTMVSGSGDTSNILKQLPQKNTVLFDKNMIQNIRFEYDSLETLGADRVLNSYAATHLFPNQNNLIIDIGTCLTCSFIDQDQVFRGGSISPGLKMRAKAMHDYTFKLPLIDIKDSFFNPIGASTLESLQSGVFLGLESEINYRIQLFLDKYSQLNVILTGGDAVFFENRIKNKIFANLNLTLIGMNYLIQHV